MYTGMAVTRRGQVQTQGTQPRCDLVLTQRGEKHPCRGMAGITDACALSQSSTCIHSASSLHQKKTIPQLEAAAAEYRSMHSAYP